MQFNSEANTLDLVSDIDYLAGTDVNLYSLKDKTRNANFALDRVIALIQKADGRWDYDDTNQTGELLSLASNLVSGTQKYAIDVTWLKIAKVRVKDSAGNWISLTPVDRRELSDAQLTASSGTPARYDKLGNYIYLYPAPNYASTGGLEVQYQRGASYFVYTDTTKTPGFATQFHRLVSLYAALNYCQINGLIDRVNIIQGIINVMEAELVGFYSQRDNDEQPHISLRRDDYGEGSDFGNGLISNPSNPHGF